MAITEGAPNRVENPRDEWTTEDKSKATIDNVAKDIVYKKIWEKLI